jgi:cystathionine gamma-synthase
MRFETRAIHVGQDPDAEFGAVSVPIYQTSTYAQPAVGKPKAYDYARSGNPTREALQEVLASLEGGTRALSFSSGLGATTTLLLTLRPGDHIVLGDDVYGGTYRLLARVMNGWGIEFETVDLTDEVSLRSAIRDRTRIVWLETPTNPLMKIVDIERVAAISREAGAMCVVDNTFATPYLQKPLELGADVVVHSVTKYLGGHSDLIGGFLATNDPTVAERLYFLQKSLGAVPGPFDSWLVLRGLKTLAVRMRQHCVNAHSVAAFLERHPRVERVLYPGLPSHPGHTIAAHQMRDFGGMVSFLAESEEEAVALCARTRIFRLAESLGGVESLIEHPARMTHASTADAPFAAPRNLVRLSVGLESAEDLIADLEAALVRSAAAAGA